MDNFKALQKRAARVQRDWETEKYRTLWRRIGSGIIDSAILFLPLILLILLVKLFSIPGKYLAVMTISQLFSIMFSIYFVGLTGTTPGKWLFGMKVVLVADEEEKIGLQNSSLRELLNATSLLFYLAMIVTYSLQGRLAESDRIVQNNFHDVLWDVATVVGLVIGYSEILTAIFNKKRRAFHDFIAKTVVVKSEMRHRILSGSLIVVSFGIYFVYFQVYNLLKN